MQQDVYLAVFGEEANSLSKITLHRKLCVVLKSLADQGVVHMVDEQTDTYQISAFVLGEMIVKILEEEGETCGISGVALEFIVAKIHQEFTLKNISREIVDDAVNSLIEQSKVIDYGNNSYRLM